MILQTTYCERGLSSALWAEPINALTNIAFFVVAFIGYRLLKRRHPQDSLLLTLPALLACVGAGSLLYHTARSSTTVLLDGIPIFVFILWALFLILKSLTRSFWHAWVWWILFLVIQVISTMFVPASFLNGSIRHAITISSACVVGWFLTRVYGAVVARPLSMLLVAYVAAITFRSIDMLVCSEFVLGTHFLWHILTAVAGYWTIVLVATVRSAK